MEKHAPAGSTKRAMMATGTVGTVLAGGAAGAVLSGPAALLGFVVGALAGALVVAGLVVSDGALDKEAAYADKQQPSNAKLEDALMGRVSGETGGDGSNGGNSPSGGNGPNP